MQTKYKKITDFFNPISNPAGGAPVNFGLPPKKSVVAPTMSMTTANSTPALPPDVAKKQSLSNVKHPECEQHYSASCYLQHTPYRAVR